MELMDPIPFTVQDWSYLANTVLPQRINALQEEADVLESYANATEAEGTDDSFPLITPAGARSIADVKRGERARLEQMQSQLHEYLATI